MKNRTSIMGLFGAMILATVLCLDATRLSAQPIPWNPPCVATKIVNTTGCRALVTVRTNFGFVGPVGVGANATALINFPPGTIISGVVTQAGTSVPVTSPGPAIPPPGPGTPSAAFVTGVTFGPPPGCCFDVYFEQPPGASGCYIWLLPGTPPCIP